MSRYSSVTEIPHTAISPLQTVNEMHGFGQQALNWFSGHFAPSSQFSHRTHTASSAHAAAVVLGRTRADPEHARVRVLGRVSRLRPAFRPHEDAAGDAGGGDERAAAEATSLEERGVPATHLHFSVERALRRMGVATRSDVTAHRGELFPDLFLVPPPHHHSHHAHHPRQPHHHQHRHHHHSGHQAEARQRVDHADGGAGAGGVIVQALDSACFVPGTATPTDYVLAKQVSPNVDDSKAARSHCLPRSISFPAAILGDQ